ncbi:NADH-quinone oxidoreductase subunit NuoG [Endothiovibrio diazotrophicus]
MVKFEINGTEVEAPAGTMLIDAADNAGIKIPRFCYHKKLSVSANCRMCLVEVEKAPKPMPACATPVNAGMKVFTRSPKAIAAQRGTMEFLLINHPLDCPICDQGGECELQDLSMGYGRDLSQFSEGKRAVPDPDLGPLVATEMTRCIHCTRCVRFGVEIAGVPQLGATGRGEHTVIGTYVEQALTSELAGNIIDLCPVGALTSKPYRFTARSWELRQSASIAPHDGVGSNINIHTLRGKVMRVVPRDNEALNEQWISDRDRFSYQAVNSGERLLRPMIKENGNWVETDWNRALEVASQALWKVSGNDLGVLVSPNATSEEMVLAARIAKGLGCDNIDHRLNQADFRDQELAPAFPYLGSSVEALESMNAALVVGSNLRKEQPILAHRLRKAAQAGGSVIFLNPADFELNYRAAASIGVAPGRMVGELAAIAKAAAEVSGKSAPAGVAQLISKAEASDQHTAIARHLSDGEQATVLLGNLAIAHPDYAVLRSLAMAISGMTGAAFGVVGLGANAAGAWLTGCVPHREIGGEAKPGAGMDARAMLADARRGYLLLGVEPELDCWDSAAAVSALAGAEQVVALTSFVSDALKERAGVLLPIATFAETSGSYLNAEGRLQSFNGAVAPAGDARPAWKVLRVLGNLLELEGFDYEASSEVIDDALRAVLEAPSTAPGSCKAAEATFKDEGVQRIGETPIHSADAVVRRAPALQASPDGWRGSARIAATLAGKLGVGEGDAIAVACGDHRITLPATLDTRLPGGCVWLPVGVAETAGFGPAFATVTLEKA